MNSSVKICAKMMEGAALLFLYILSCFVVRRRTAGWTIVAGMYTWSDDQ